MKNIKTKLCSLFIVILIFGIYGCKENEQKHELDDVSIENKLLYSRAFEVALWALPVTESFSARIALASLDSIFTSENISSIDLGIMSTSFCHQYNQ